MKKEMFDKLESLDELSAAIDAGIDIEFILYGVRYNISWRDGSPFICVCPDGTAVCFKDASDMLAQYTVDGIPLKEVWEDFQILAM